MLNVQVLPAESTMLVTWKAALTLLNAATETSSVLPAVLVIGTVIEVPEAPFVLLV